MKHATKFILIPEDTYNNASMTRSPRAALPSKKDPVINEYNKILENLGGTSSTSQKVSSDATDNFIMRKMIQQNVSNSKGSEETRLLKGLETLLKNVLREKQWVDVDDNDTQNALPNFKNSTAQQIVNKKVKKLHQTPTKKKKLLAKTATSPAVTRSRKRKLDALSSSQIQPRRTTRIPRPSQKLRESYRISSPKTKLLSQWRKDF